MRLAALLVLALALAGAGCRRAPATRIDPAPAATAPAPVEPVPADSTAPLDDASLYDLDLALVDHDGATVALADHRGHPVLVTMFYASCPAACPVLIEELRAIDAAIAADARADLRVLLVSFDPARDRPEQLRALAAARGLDLDRWTLAAATDADARLLAAVLGVKYRRLASGEFSHTSVITALDRDGHPLARLDGFGRDHAPLVAAVERAAAR
jgi:protein SCO1/2